MKLRFPIRFKIVLLILAALSASLLSYLYVGTQLIVEDKVSYIYDYTLAEVKSASDKIGSQLARTASVAGLMGSMTGSGSGSTSGSGSKAEAQALFDQHAKDLGFTGALLLRPLDASRFKSELAMGNTDGYTSALEQLGWTPQAFDQQSILIGTPLGGTGSGGDASRLPIGVRIKAADGGPLLFFAMVSVDQALVADGGKNYEVRLMGALGKTLLTKPASTGAITPAQFDEFAKTLISGTFDSGVRDWSSDGKEYITSYQRLAAGKLTVVSLISKDTAFVAAKQLVTRSLFLGLSILLLAVGLTLVVVRGLTGKLREMWHATQKVGQGDFTVRVDTRKLPGDEVGGLALSFNTMADKIGELMKQTAQKVRMEKELETAQAVQSRFFPNKPFDHEMFKVAGRYVPASECAGDWWHYGQIGSQVVVVVGDVTGHGVSAALVTAAAHTTFSLVMKQFAADPAGGVSIEGLVWALNNSVLAAAAGQSTMTFVASIIDLSTGMMTTSNASHPPLYIFRAKEGVTNPLSLFKPIMDGRIASLGENEEIKVEKTTYQLEPGDRIFWYTDGIMEARMTDGEKLNKTAFLKMLAAKAGDANAAEKICTDVMSETLRFFSGGTPAADRVAGEHVEERPDDITLVVASIPATAQFVIAGARKAS